MKKDNLISISILVATVIIAGAIFLVGKGGGGALDDFTLKGNNISVVDGKQIIEIHAKGGYSPRSMVAKAGIPTVIKMVTNGSFDCSSALSIPAIGYRSNLSPTGETLIDIPAQKAGAKMEGICAMGMYNFSIEFN